MKFYSVHYLYASDLIFPDLEEWVHFLNQNFVLKMACWNAWHANSQTVLTGFGHLISCKLPMLFADEVSFLSISRGAGSIINWVKVKRRTVRLHLCKCCSRTPSRREKMARNPLVWCWIQFHRVHLNSADCASDN